MNILSITAGAAGMYCGSCYRDNALATELLARGHAVTLVPVYTPTRTDEPNVSRHRVFFGGLSVYLQQYVPLFRRTPRFLDRLFDSPRLIAALASRSLSTDPRMLGELTVSMLRGSDGVLRKEFDKLLDWVADEPRPDVVNLPNSLLISMAGPLGEALGCPICCTLQGEELFLDGLVEPYRREAMDLIKGQIRDVDRFVAVSDYCAAFMSEFLTIPPDRISVVPLGINMDGYRMRTPEDGVFRVGYFARVAPEKGLHVLAEAYAQFRRRAPQTRARLDVAGYLSAAHRPYLERVRRGLVKAGLGEEFTYRGAVDRSQKLTFLQNLDVLSVPATYDEPKGLFLLEAMASGVPVLQPRRGAFTEIVERTDGGVLVEPDSVSSLVDGLLSLSSNRDWCASLGQRGHAGVRAHYTVARATERLLDVYEGLTRNADRPSGQPTPPPVPVA